MDVELIQKIMRHNLITSWISFDAKSYIKNEKRAHLKGALSGVEKTSV
jgi:hypothetical protein